MSAKQQPVFTVGHSTHSFDAFVSLLRRHGIDAVADVRSAPYSRFNPQFNRDSIDRALRANGIRYVFLGLELGARPKDPRCYENGQVQYTRLAQTPYFLRGIERILQGSQNFRLALMCAEKEPLDCHRALLVAPALVHQGVSVEHILADDRIETHGDAMLRLLRLVGLPHEDLFRSEADLVNEALSRQAQRVAFVDEGALRASPTIHP